MRDVCRTVIALINDLHVISFDETRLVYLGDVKNARLTCDKLYLNPIHLSSTSKWRLSLSLQHFWVLHRYVPILNNEFPSGFQTNLILVHSSKTKINFVWNPGPGFPDHRTRSKSNWSGIQSANRTNFGPVVKAFIFKTKVQAN